MTSEATRRTLTFNFISILKKIKRSVWGFSNQHNLGGADHLKYLHVGREKLFQKWLRAVNDQPLLVRKETEAAHC
jgi:hypothetical protein